MVTADQSPVTGTTDTPVSGAVTGLTPNTTYHYRVVGQNTAGTTNGADLTFTTQPIPPTLTTTTASGISTTGATLNGIVNANNMATATIFEYGLSTSYGLTVTADQSPVSGMTDTAVTGALSGLAPNTTYHYRVVGTNIAGTTYGADMAFTTVAAWPLSVTKEGRGDGTVVSDPEGIDCGSDCLETYAHNTVVTLTATPAHHSRFIGWSGDPDCEDGIVTVSGAMNCTANFYRFPWWLFFEAITKDPPREP
jgi:hypothetical protein